MRTVDDRRRDGRVRFELGGKAAAASAGFDGIGVVEGEPALVQVVIKIDRHSVEEQIAALIDGYFNAMLLADVVFGVVGCRIESETVLIPAATTTGHADAQQSVFGVLLIGNDPLNLAGGFFGDRDRHRMLYSV